MSRVADSKGEINSPSLLTIKSKKVYSLGVAQKIQNEPVLKQVKFGPSPEENAIIQAGMRKHGLKKAVDVIRMALRRFAESEGIRLKAS